MQDIPLYGAADVERWLDYDGCIAAVRDAMAAFTADGIAQPLRNILPIGPGKLLGLMPGALSGEQGFGVKLVTVFANPARPGRSSHRGIVALFDHETGAVKAIADAGAVTKIRTAAASAVATDALARTDAKTLAIFGCGAEAATHIRAIARVRSLEEILVWGRSADRAAAFAARMADDSGLTVRMVPDGREAAEQADIICTVTGAATPILLGEWVKPGTHINAVGSSHAGPVEVDTALVVASRYIADSRASVLAAGSEFLVARQVGAIDEAHIVAEIGEVLLGRVPGRTSGEDITFYKSLGHVVQDMAAIRYLHQRATQAG